MSTTMARTDRSIISEWWWTVDRVTLLLVLLLIATGAVLIVAASPAVADRIGASSSWHFAVRQLIFLVPALIAMFVVSLMSPRGVRRVALIGFAVAYVMMLGTLLIGEEVKGASRWLSLGGLSIQPSEFAKPFFAVTAAWMFAEQRRAEGVPGYLISCLLFAAMVTVLILQPDFGMTVVVTSVWATQFFIAGLPLVFVFGLAISAIAGGFAAYAFIPHVTSRVDRFLDPASGDNYQIERAMDAFSRGGFLGQGPGEGLVKRVLPDAHTDFIFAVAGEEFGVIACILIVAAFAAIALRSFARLLREDDLFVLVAACGLTTLFALQAIINMGVNLRLLPTKGMTLPFISYGGSSMLALAIGMGMLLALTRRRPRGMV